MDQDDAIALIRGVVTEPGGTWADLGAGAGTFTLALASLLGPGGVVYAVDRDAGALRQLERTAARRPPGGAPIRVVAADFTAATGVEMLPPLDGVVMANALHFVPYAEQAGVLRRVAAAVGPTGPIVVIEYDRRHANPWVPYPIAPVAFAKLARDAGLGVPTLLGTRPSAYSGTLYSVAVRHNAAPA